jgi:hypothetical protein
MLPGRVALELGQVFTIRSHEVAHGPDSPIERGLCFQLPAALIAQPAPKS